MVMRWRCAVTAWKGEKCEFNVQGAEHCSAQLSSLDFLRLCWKFSVCDHVGQPHVQWAMARYVTQAGQSKHGPWVVSEANSFIIVKHHRPLPISYR